MLIDYAQLVFIILRNEGTDDEILLTKIQSKLMDDGYRTVF